MIIKVCICSFIIIILLHYLYNFLLATLTVPKVKDLVIKPQKQYEKILRFEESIHADAEGGRSHVTRADANDAAVMRDELMLFIKERNADK